MSKTNDTKASQLGMPFGTATARLRKMLLFQAIQKLGEDVCYKCKQKIEKIEDFTIEHKKPWLHVTAKLFWDLQNIAYSHAACNRADRPHPISGIDRRVISPEGMAWCHHCKQHKALEHFSSDESRWNGKHCRCKDCQHYYRDRPLVEQQTHQTQTLASSKT